MHTQCVHTYTPSRTYTCIMLICVHTYKQTHKLFFFGFMVPEWSRDIHWFLVARKKHKVCAGAA